MCSCIADGSVRRVCAFRVDVFADHRLADCWFRASGHTLFIMRCWCIPRQFFSETFDATLMTFYSGVKNSAPHCTVHRSQIYSRHLLRARTRWTNMAKCVVHCTEWHISRCTVPCVFHETGFVSFRNWHTELLFSVQLGDDLFDSALHVAWN
jgi:hypothetical protein